MTEKISKIIDADLHQAHNNNGAICKNVLNLNNLIDSDQKQADEDNCIRYGCGSVAQSPIIFAVEVQL